MELKGWNSQGRNIETKLHEQFFDMINILNNKDFTKNKNFTELKTDLGQALGISEGQLGTIKTVIEALGLVNTRMLERYNTNFEKNALLTDLGKVLHSLIAIENEVTSLPTGTIPPNIKRALYDMYRGFYSEAMIYYYFPTGGRKDSNPLHPGRAIMKQLRNFQSLDFFEFYLLCTHIYEDDNITQEEKFRRDIAEYRSGKLRFNKSNITEYVKGHQYLPQWMEMGGLIKIYKGSRLSEWLMIETTEMKELNDELLHPNFLKQLYKKDEGE